MDKCQKQMRHFPQLKSHMLTKICAFGSCLVCTLQETFETLYLHFLKAWLSDLLYTGSKTKMTFRASLTQLWLVWYHWRNHSVKDLFGVYSFETFPIVLLKVSYSELNYLKQHLLMWHERSELHGHSPMPLTSSNVYVANGIRKTSTCGTTHRCKIQAHVQIFLCLPQVTKSHRQKLYISTLYLRKTQRCFIETDAE